MSKIVVSEHAGFGHMIPMLGPVAELVRRGNDVVVYNSIEFESLVRGTGASFVAYPPALNTMDFAKRLKDGNLIAAFEMLLGATGPLTDFALERLPLEKPDVVVFDSAAFWGYIATKTLKLPNVSNSPIFVFELFRNLTSWRELWGHVRNFIPGAPRLALALMQAAALRRRQLATRRTHGPAAR